MKKWLSLAGVVLPLLILLLFVNIYVDPANVFHSVSEDVVKSVNAGKDTYVLGGNANEREVKKMLVETLPKDVDTVVIGPSLAMTIGADEYGKADGVYNLAVSNAGFNDVLNTFGMIIYNEIWPKNIVLCIDTKLFDPAACSDDDRWMEQSDYAKIVLDEIGYSDYNIDESNNILGKIGKLFSISYFQGGIDYLRENGMGVLSQARAGVVNEFYVGPYFKGCDCSLVYAQSIINGDEKLVVEDANAYSMHDISKGIGMEDMNREILEEILLYFQNEGVNVQLFISPFAPALWDKINKEDYPIFEEMERWAFEFAKVNGMTIGGSLNPYVLGVSNKDFYDARHMRREKMGICLEDRQ